jgi:hypothetical protein
MSDNNGDQQWTIPKFDDFHQQLSVAFDTHKLYERRHFWQWVERWNNLQRLAEELPAAIKANSQKLLKSAD